jgi:hypothetical protein
MTQEPITKPLKPFNPRTLDFKIGQKVSWEDIHGQINSGMVINIAYEGLVVSLKSGQERFLNFSSLVKCHTW